MSGSTIHLLTVDGMRQRCRSCEPASASQVLPAQWRVVTDDGVEVDYNSNFIVAVTFGTAERMLTMAPKEAGPNVRLQYLCNRDGSGLVAHEIVGLLAGDWCRANAARLPLQRPAFSRSVFLISPLRGGVFGLFEFNPLWVLSIRPAEITS